MPRALLVFHRWLALTIGALLILIALSGAIVVFEGPLATANATHVAVGARPLSLDTLAARAVAAAGGGTVNAISPGRAPNEAFGFSVANGSVGQDLLVDPYTGAVLGPVPGPSRMQRIVSRIHQLHSSLLSGRPGQVIVSLVTLGSLLLVLSGLVLWWRERAWRVRWSASWKRIVYDLHHALGIVSAVFLIVIMSTGVWIGFSKQINPLLQRLDDPPQVARAPEQPAPPPGATPISLDSIARSAHSVAPDAPIVLMLLPPKGAAQIALRYPEDRTPGGRSRAVIDRYRGTVLWSSITRTAGTGTRLIDLQRAVHTGDIFGPVTQIVWFLVSIILASQVVTGVLMWWNGRKGRAVRRGDRAGATAQ